MVLDGDLAQLLVPDVAANAATGMWRRRVGVTGRSVHVPVRANRSRIVVQQSKSGGALIKTLDRPSVEAAAKAYDAAADKAAFRRRFDRGARSDYNLVLGRKRYPSKVIVSAAYEHMTGKQVSGFSGGMSGAALVLVNLGFEIDDVTPRNPNWSEDELILALELYRQVGLANQAHPAVIALSELLRRWGAVVHGGVATSYRNPNGIKLKLANFRALDPVFTALGRVGMRRGNSLEKVVWGRYAADLKGLGAAAERLRINIGALETEVETDDGDDPAVEEDAEEGGVTYRLHRRIERSATLRAKKIKLAIKTNPKLACEACDFSFLEAFGPAGAGFAEVHHIDPLHLPKGTRRTSTRDLAIVCANCHRMAHRGGELRSIAELRALLRQVVDAA
jgi:5-methylcytosine-specific restriction protein A